MVLGQNWPFFHRTFLAKIGQKNVFYDILEEKNAFLGKKNNNLKMLEYRQFSKNVSP